MRLYKSINTKHTAEKFKTHTNKLNAEHRQKITIRLEDPETKAL